MEFTRNSHSHFWKKDGKQYGDEYLAELDFIEVVERQKEGYESDVEDPDDNIVNDNAEEEDDDDDYQSDNAGNDAAGTSDRWAWSGDVGMYVGLSVCLHHSVCKRVCVCGCAHAWMCVCACGGLWPLCKHACVWAACLCTCTCKHAHRCVCLYVEEEVVEERGKKGRQEGHVWQLLLRWTDVTHRRVPLEDKAARCHPNVWTKLSQQTTCASKVYYSRDAGARLGARNGLGRRFRLGMYNACTNSTLLNMFETFVHVLFTF